MPGAAPIAQSGLNAEQLRVNASAHNTANQTTDGFAKQRVRQSESPAGGTRARVDVVDLSPQTRQLADALPGPQNNVDAAEEAVVRIEANAGYKQNAQVIRTQDQMQKTLLDTFA